MKILGFCCLAAVDMIGPLTLRSYFQVENFFVGGRSLPLFVITLTLASQSIDSNATLGNADLAYKFQ